MAVQSQVYADFSSVGVPFDELSNVDFSFNQQFAELQQHPQQIQQQNHFLRSRPPCLQQSWQQKNQFVASHNNENNFVFSAVKTKPAQIPIDFSKILTNQLQNQRVEIDKFFNIQNVRLKSALREQKQQHLTSFISKLESRVAMVMRQTDEQIAQASKKSMDLQQHMKRMEVENQSWMKIARESEAMIVHLNSTMEQLKNKAAISLQPRLAEDSESCCDVWVEEEVKAEERNSKRRKKMMCRRCEFGNSSMLFLPCRHLCCCKACEAFLYSCPVCNSVKEGCIEALIC